jgi:hypothetical protein
MAEKDNSGFYIESNVQPDLYKEHVSPASGKKEADPHVGIWEGKHEAKYKKRKNKHGVVLPKQTLSELDGDEPYRNADDYEDGEPVKE